MEEVSATRKIEVALSVTIGLPNYSGVKAVVGLEETFPVSEDRQANIDTLYTAISKSLDGIIVDARAKIAPAVHVEPAVFAATQPPTQLGNFVQPRRLSQPEIDQANAAFEATGNGQPVAPPMQPIMPVGQYAPPAQYVPPVNADDPLAGCPWGLVESCRVTKTGTKKNGQPYTAYAVRIDGRDLGTFSHGVAKIATEAQATGRRVQYRAAQNGKYWNLDLLKIDGGEWVASN